MVTLGLLPALAYERSALGREVGMEGSGIVRRIVGSDVRNIVVLATRWFSYREDLLPIGWWSMNTSSSLNLSGLSMEEAASTLSVYVTAFYSLDLSGPPARGASVFSSTPPWAAWGRLPSPWPNM